MPKIFKYGNIPNISFTPDKERNILIYIDRLPTSSYTGVKLLKMVRFFWHTLYVCMNVYMYVHVHVYVYYLLL